MSDASAATGGRSPPRTFGRSKSVGDPAGELAGVREEAIHADRVEALAAWVRELDARVRAIEVAGDPKSLEELRMALEAWSKHDPKLQDRLTNRIDVLTDRVNTLAKTVATTTAGLAGREGEIASLRRELDEANARADAAFAELRTLVDPTPVAELQQAVEALSKNAVAVEAFSDEATELRESYQQLLNEFTERADILAGRLDSLVGATVTTNAGLAAHEHDLTELRAGLEAGTTRVDEVVAGVRQAIDSLSSHLAAAGERASAARVESLEERLDAIGASVLLLAERVESLTESAAKRAEEGGVELSELRHRPRTGEAA